MGLLTLQDQRTTNPTISISIWLNLTHSLTFKSFFLELPMATIPLVCQGSDLERTLTTLMLDFFSNSSWTILPHKNALLLQVASRIIKSMLTLLRRDLETFSQSLSTNSLDNQHNTLVVNIDNGLRLQQQTLLLPLSPATGAQKISTLITL